MKSVLITGVTGQDGSYLAELLLAKGYRVVGAVRDVQRAAGLLPPTLVNRVELTEWDMLDPQRMVEVLSHYRPAELYNFAAYSSGAGMYDDPVGISEVNGLAVTRILQAIREVDETVRFCQASSSEMFGDATETPQSEETPFYPRSPYGAAKLYAHSMVRIYRQRYGLFACSAILFNHESPRRSEDYVTRKISRTVARIAVGQARNLTLGNLDSCRDWGYAADYVYAMWLMLQQGHGEDFVIATGETHSVRECCKLAFAHVGLDYRDFVETDPELARPVDRIELCGNPARAKQVLGWQPTIGFAELVCMMVDADLARLRDNHSK
jgi:GDPmannose 4,6-dehydratase